LDKAEIEKRWPEAVARARELREVFGDGVRLLWAKNQNGEELGKPSERIECRPSAYSSPRR
jgi:hypothetical protein